MRISPWLLLLAVLPTLAQGAGVGATRLQTVLMPHGTTVLLRVYNGERGTLLVRRAQILVADVSDPEKMACVLPVNVVRSVKRGASRDLELLGVEDVADCSRSAGYRVPSGMQPVEISDTHDCAACLPVANGGEEPVVIPFTVRVVMSGPGIIEEYRKFTNYLFFQYPPRRRPIVIQ